MTIPEKKVSESTVTIVQQMVQSDANLAGNVHGGVIMKLIDNTAGIAAMRHTQKNCVTASLDRLDFHNPVFVGDLLRISASVNFTGRTSMEIGARIEAENYITGDNRHTASAYLTFVALDDAGKPSEIPQIILETEDDARRNKQAADRRANRLKERAGEKTHKKIP